MALFAVLVSGDRVTANRLPTTEVRVEQLEESDDMEGDQSDSQEDFGPSGTQEMDEQKV